MRLAFTYEGERIKENVEELAATLPASLLYKCDVGSDDEIRAVFGFPMVPDIMKLASIRPDFLRVLLEGYKAMFSGGHLPRQVKEMIATVVSQANSCAY